MKGYRMIKAGLFCVNHSNLQKPSMLLLPFVIKKATRTPKIYFFFSANLIRLLRFHKIWAVHIPSACNAIFIFFLHSHQKTHSSVCVHFEEPGGKIIGWKQQSAKGFAKTVTISDILSQLWAAYELPKQLSPQSLALPLNNGAVFNSKHLQNLSYEPKPLTKRLPIFTFIYTLMHLWNLADKWGKTIGWNVMNYSPLFTCLKKKGEMTDMPSAPIWAACLAWKWRKEMNWKEIFIWLLLNK